MVVIGVLNAIKMYKVKLKEIISLYEEHGFKYKGYSKISEKHIFRIPDDWYQLGTIIDGTYVKYFIEQLEYHVERYNKSKSKSIWLL